MAVEVYARTAMKELLVSTVRSAVPFTSGMYSLNRVIRVAVTWLDHRATNVTHRMALARVAMVGRVEHVTR